MAGKTQAIGPVNKRQFGGLTECLISVTENGLLLQTIKDDAKGGFRVKLLSLWEVKAYCLTSGFALVMLERCVGPATVMLAGDGSEAETRQPAQCGVVVVNKIR